MDTPEHIVWRGHRQVVETGGCKYISIPRSEIRDSERLDIKELESGRCLTAEITDDGELRLSLPIQDPDQDPDQDQPEQTTQ
jgi:hypothetical protein